MCSKVFFIAIWRRPKMNFEPENYRDKVQLHPKSKSVSSLRLSVHHSFPQRPSDKFGDYVPPSRRFHQAPIG